MLGECFFWGRFRGGLGRVILGEKKKEVRSPLKKKAQFVATKSAVCWKRKRSYFYTTFNSHRKPAPAKGLRAVVLSSPKTVQFQCIFTPKNRPISGPISGHFSPPQKPPKFGSNFRAFSPQKNHPISDPISGHFSLPKNHPISGENIPAFQFILPLQFLSRFFQPKLWSSFFSAFFGESFLGDKRYLS